MNLPELVGNDSLKKALAPVDQAHLPHAIILEGPEGTGRHTVTRLLCANLLCEDSDAPCGVCSQCSKVFSDQHPDVHILKNPEGKLPVEEIRKLREALSVLSGEGGARVAVLSNADLLSAPCQNALLKLLEEPPENTYFILICENAAGLLPTVRSRCVRYATAPLTDEEMEIFLHKSFPTTSSDAIRKAAAAAEGSIGRALAAVREDFITTLPPFGERYFSALVDGTVYELFSAIESLTELESADYPQLFGIMRKTVRNVAMYAMNGSAKNLLPPPPECLCRHISIQCIAQLSGMLGELFDRAVRHANPAALTAYMTAESVKLKERYYR